jgi:hypothetical protein
MADQDLYSLSATERAHFATLKSINPKASDVALVEAAKQRAADPEAYPLQMGNTPNPSVVDKFSNFMEAMDKSRREGISEGQDVMRRIPGFGPGLAAAYGPTANFMTSWMTPTTPVQGALTAAGGAMGSGMGPFARGGPIGSVPRQALTGAAVGAGTQMGTNAYQGRDLGQGVVGSSLEGAGVGTLTGLGQYLGQKFVAMRKRTQMEAGAQQGQLARGADILDAYKKEVSPEVQAVLGGDPANIITRRRDLEGASSQAFEKMEQAVKNKVGKDTFFNVPTAPDSTIQNYMTALKQGNPGLTDADLWNAVQFAQTQGQLPQSTVQMTLSDLLKGIKTYKKAGDPYGKLLEDTLVTELNQPHWANPGGTQTLGGQYRTAVDQYAKEMDWLKFLEKWGPGSDRAGGGMAQKGTNWMDALDSARDLWLRSQAKGDVGWRMDAVRHPEFQKLLWQGQVPGSRDEEILSAMTGRHGAGVLRHLINTASYASGFAGGRTEYMGGRALAEMLAAGAGGGGRMPNQMLRVGPQSPQPMSDQLAIPSIMGILGGGQTR